MPLDWINARSIPFLSRRNYYYELKHIIPWSFAAGLIQGYFGSVVVAKSFNGSERLIAIASATPFAAFLFSLFWGMLCVGRPKIRLFSMLAGGAALVLTTIGLIPPTPAGAIWFVCLMAAAQVLMSGVVTVRSAVWKSNYPRTFRGRITARLEALRFVIGLVAVLAAAFICDRAPGAYRYVYPIAGALGLIGVALLGKLHVRGEKRELGGQAAQGTRSGAETAAEPVAVTALLSPRHQFSRMLEILRADRPFCQYCVAQSFTGIANLMTVPVAAAIVTHHLDLGLAWAFWISTAVLQAIPQLTRLGSIGRWARYFDRVGVVRFRVFNVWWWALSLAFGMGGTLAALYPTAIGAAALPAAVLLFALRGLAAGVAHGGGSIAWQIGHLHFARPQEAEVYMGIHVFLTGLRGVIAPAIGIVLFETVGWPVWLVGIASAILSLGLYIRLARREARNQGSEVASGVHRTPAV